MTPPLARLPLPATPAGHESIARHHPVSRIVAEMSEPNSPTMFVPDAERRLLAASDDLTARVGIAAVIVARERGGTAVDVSDVNSAVEKINNPAPLQASNGVREILLALFGVFAGGSIGTFTAVFAANPNYSSAWAVGAILMAVSAISCFVFAMTKGPGP